ncbi:MAG: Gfo/Idh/MocA family protein [Thermomicrobiales bacterium]
MRVGIVGCGNVGLRAFIPAVIATEGLQLVAVADPTPSRLGAAAEAGGLESGALHLNWSELIARPDVDAVIVATPQQARPEIAIAAAAAGKHLLCEKPLAAAPADATRMVDAARQQGVLLATVHNYQFLSVYEDLKQIVTSGEIGELEVATLNFLSVEDRPGAGDYRPRWRHDVAQSGGGVLMDMLHAVYLGFWLFDARPTRVSAYVDRRRDDSGDVEDIALVRYDVPGGCVMVNMAWGEGPGGVDLMGTAGRALLVTERHGTHPFVAPSCIRVVGRHGERTFPPEPNGRTGHACTVENFRDAVLNLAPAAATGEDGVAVLEAVVGAYESATLEREVHLPLSPDDPVYRRGALGVSELAVPIDNRVRQRGLFGFTA